MGAESPLPDDEDRPQHEHAGQHEARHHAGDEQAADRGFGGDAVEDKGDRRRNQDAERAAGADRAGGHVVRIAAPPHLRNAHLADGRAAGRRRAGERGKDGAGAEIGNHQAARHPVKPTVERFVEVLAGGRRADGGAHHHEHRDGDQREFVEARPERLGDNMHAVEAMKKQKEDDRNRAEAERDGNARHQHQKGDDENERSLAWSGSWRVSQRLPGLSPCELLGVLFRLNAEGRRAAGDQANQFGEILQDQQARARPASKDRESTAARARPCSSASLPTTPDTNTACRARTAPRRSSTTAMIVNSASQ